MAVGHSQVGVNPGDVEAELAGVLRCEPADLEFDDHEAGLRPVEEQQVNVEVIAIDSEVVLPANKREPVAELEQEGLQPHNQGGFQVSFGGRPGEL